MPEEDELEDDTVASLAAAILGFIQAHPNHFGSLALVNVMAREAAGVRVPADERMLALTTIVQELRRRR